MQHLVKNRNLTGIILVFLYCLTSAFSVIVVSQYEQTFNPLKLTLYNFLFAAIFFNCLALPRMSQLITQIKNNKRLFWIINIASVLAWLPLFYSLKYLEPAVVMAIVFGLIPIASLLFSLQKVGLKSLNKQDIIFVLLIAFVVAMLIAVYLYDLQNISTTGKYHIYSSLLLTVVAGIGTAWVVANMKALNVQGFSTIQVMAMRFYLMVALSAILVGYLNISFTFTMQQFVAIVIITFLTIILPLFLLQKGAERTDPVNVGFILPLQPLIIYGYQMFEGRFHPSLGIFILLIILGSIIITSAYVKIKHIYLNG